MIWLMAIIGYLTVMPLLLTIANSFALKTPSPLPGVPLRLSLLIPARNEEASIGQALTAALASDHPDFEIVVLDDHSTDATAEIVRSFEDPRIRLESAPPLPPGWSGKIHACHCLGALATGELLVFVDCDVTLAPRALSALDGFMRSRPHIGYASGVPRQVTVTLAEKLVVSLVPFLLMAYLPVAIMRRSRSTAYAAGCGQLIVVRRDAYQAAGGHASIMRTLHDGLKLPRRFREVGLGTDLFDATGIASCRMYDGWKQVWNGFSKNATEGMASPKALPVWTFVLTFGQVLPYVLIPFGWPFACFAAASLLSRLIVAFRSRGSLIGALLHPIGVIVMLDIQCFALMNAKRKRPSVWRGREYIAQ
jgi:glycosyltransferase involved in cell wall biosynthesis